MEDDVKNPLERSAEDLLAECLALSRSEWSDAVRDACRARPELAQPLDQLFANVRAIDGVLNCAEDPIAGAALGPGSILGDYELVERVGGGGMGIVYRATQRSLNRTVALKLVRPELLRLEKAKERFRRETEAIARLHDPGIVPLYEAGEDAGIPFFTMEFIEGQSVADVLNVLRFRDVARLRAADFASAYRQGAPRLASPPDEGVFSSLEQRSWAVLCCRIVSRAARALDHAHRNGVVHRDVKPSNLMVTDSGRVVLVDFGLAVAEGASSLTRTGSHPGSLPYMAPEQLAGRPVDERTDIYSLGVTLYELLTLRCPFPLSNQELARKNIVSGAYERPRAKNRTIPLEIEAVCLKAMERDPSHRYATASSFADDLVSAVFHRPLIAKTFSWPRRTVRLLQRHPARSLACMALFLAFVVSPALFALLQRRHAREIEIMLGDSTRATHAAERFSRESEEAASVLEEILATLGAAPDSRSQRHRLDRAATSIDRLNRSGATHSVRMSLAMAHSYRALGARESAELWYTEALTHAQRPGMPRTQLGQALIESSYPAEWSGDYKTALRRITEGIATIGEISPLSVARGYERAARLHFLCGDIKASCDAVHSAISATGQEASANQDYRLLTARLRLRLTEYLFYRGDHRSAAIELSQCRRICEAHGDNALDIECSYGELRLAESMGDPGAVLFLGNKIALLAQSSLGERHELVIVSRISAERANAKQGNVSGTSAVETIRGLCEQMPKGPYADSAMVCSAWLGLAGAMSDCQRFDDALSVVEELLPRARNCADWCRYLEYRIELARAQILCNAGRRSALNHALKRVEAIMDALGLSGTARVDFLMLLAESKRDVDRKAAETLYATIVGLCASDHTSPTYRRAAIRLGCLKFFDGRLSEAEGILRSVRNQGEWRASEVVAHAECLRVLAQIATIGGDLKDAIDLIQSAVDLCPSGPNAGLQLVWALELRTVLEGPKDSVVEAVADRYVKEAAASLQRRYVEGLLAYHRGDRLAARRLLNEAFNRVSARGFEGNHVQLAFILAEDALGDGNIGLAEDYCRQGLAWYELLSAAPGWLGARLQILQARCLAAEGNYSEAKEALSAVHAFPLGENEGGKLVKSELEAVRAMLEKAIAVDASGAKR